MADPERRQALLRALPSIDELLSRPTVRALGEPHPRALLVRALRAAVAEARKNILEGHHEHFDEGQIAHALSRLSTPHLRSVINASGVVLHTNLGRAPLANRALERLNEIASGYSNLELDLESGERGSRCDPVRELLRQLTQAEDAFVVNNCAAAVLLALSALAGGKEAIVSRGELVEIGGGFRMPDVMRQAGVTLVEVGATNRTRLRDYEQAIGPNTGLLLKVHRSNFAQVGFTESVPTEALARLARERGVLLFEDLGSGALQPLVGEELPPEPTPSDSIAAGAHVVAFSGDKLLGGPQSGILVGTAEVLQRLARHPLSRALRVDKLTMAALEATLELYRDGVADTEVPTRVLLRRSTQETARLAVELARRLSPIACQVVESEAQVGGGCLPLARLRSRAVALKAGPVDRLDLALLHQPTPIIARIVDNEVWLDLAAVLPEQLPTLADGVRRSVEEAVTC